MKKQRNKIEENLEDLLEIVGTIKDNMATKDDIKNMATKDDIKNMATKYDIERLSEEMNTRFDSLEKRTRQDTDALARDYLRLGKRIAYKK